MSRTIEGAFETRRDAEMAVERLVQEFGVERTDIFIAAEGEENSAGDARAGSDIESRAPSSPARDDAALGGKITVSVDLDDNSMIGRISEAFTEFNAIAVVQD